MYFQAYNALEEKGLKYRKVKISILSEECGQPWYMRINKYGTVPTLVHGDKVFCDSQKIIEYIDEAFPGENILVAA